MRDKRMMLDILTEMSNTENGQLNVSHIEDPFRYHQFELLNDMGLIAWLNGIPRGVHHNMPRTARITNAGYDKLSNINETV